MQNAILSIFETYIGLACIGPVIYLAAYRTIARRYGPDLARDSGRILGPALGLVLLVVPFIVEYPFVGFLLLGLWVAYVDHDWDPSSEPGGDRSGMGDHYGWLKSLLGRDDGPFDR
ncbi:hypothetical protein [Amaricoccus macauensis]|uniref:hypothetical protein n=1 Tax=Amaricoccus macauensis TaxID=57001 RepID=UPI003C79FBB1